MPARNRVSINDLPIDIVVTLLRDPDRYQPLLNGWLEAKRAAKQKEADAAARAHEAGEAERRAVERIASAEDIEAKAITAKAEAEEAWQLANAERVAAEEAGRVAVDRESAVATRETAVDEKHATLMANARTLIEA